MSYVARFSVIISKHQINKLDFKTDLEYLRTERHLYNETPLGYQRKCIAHSPLRITKEECEG